MAHLNRLTFSKEMLMQSFAPPYAFDQLPCILDHLGMKVSVTRRAARLPARTPVSTWWSSPAKWLKSIPS
jgi:hypothetical protein